MKKPDSISLVQTPPPGGNVLVWCGDFVEVKLFVHGSPREGRAVFRTNMTARGSWTDLSMEETATGEYSIRLRPERPGFFEGKACFFAGRRRDPAWPEGGNLKIKVLSSSVRSRNSIYTVFPRQFGSFREVARRLDFIMGTMGFRIVQTLPPFPVPVTYAVMGEYGCPFAATDFLSVDPAMAEFDGRTSPLDQFRELVSAVHSRKGLFFVDLPANHTGWASTLQTHHPEWFAREDGGAFRSPGAWGVKWEDLVELDYSNDGLVEYMAQVFLFWCRNGVDGFRCDAGYMLPMSAWQRISQIVRREYPDTVFMLEGLGGEIAVTDALVTEGGLDWAYSEIFQVYDRSQFEWYLPGAFERSSKFGTLVNFAETHDNNRLAAGGETYARLRVQLAALLSLQGAWGIANGVEWLATEKIDVHGRNDLNWGAEPNMVDLISRLNSILSSYETFSGAETLRVVTRGGGNTLAVLRGGDMLVVANLDCSSPVDADFDHAAFPLLEAEDLLTGRRIATGAAIRLAPGEVMCLKSDSAALVSEPTPEERGTAFFRWEFPRDERREVVVPQGETLDVSAPHHFRLDVVDPECGSTLVFRVSGAGDRAAFAVPGYMGDGSRCRRLEMKIEVYDPAGTKKARCALLVPPPIEEARAIATMDAAAIAKAPLSRAILSNGAGAAAQVRASWGALASRYDAMLSANPDRECPSDRVNVWTRLRAWLVHDGYSHEFGPANQVSFSADPAGRAAKWGFRVPCGLGRTASFEFSLSLAEGENAARLEIRRLKTSAPDVGGELRLVLRPDLEWRSFHDATKAFAGAEDLFRRSSRVEGNSFVFAPYSERFVLRADGCAFHGGPEWTYNGSHDEDAERGHGGGGDLFSPGWIELSLSRGASVSLVGAYSDAPSELRFPAVSPCPGGLRAALAEAMRLFVVRRGGNKTVIAGYPWFLDWGRDTFIFMRGMIACGMVDDALGILREFAAFEENGTLPNIIHGRVAGNRDTVDAQLWFVRCVGEIERARPGCAASLRKTCDSIVDGYLRGTPNGIRVDRDSSLVWSPSHFTWMDTNFPACTPRTGYAVEVQALWISALDFLGRSETAAKARASVERYFKSPRGYADCLDAPNGESAAAARPDFSVRPNQLFLVTLGVSDDRAIVEAAAELAVPGAMRSLSSSDPKYRGVYAGDEDTCRKQAYHNGTAWAWTFPTFVEAALMLGLVDAKSALAMLASSVELLNAGALGQICEISDGDAPHSQRGCCAQAWSAAEFLRVISLASQ